MEPVPYVLYHDDRLFVLDISMTQIRRYDDPEFGPIMESLSSGMSGAAGTWTLITRRNCPGYPPFRIDHFDSASEVAAYVRRVEPMTPRRSLGGRPPDPIPSYEEYLAWLSANALRGALETKLRGGGYFIVPEWRRKLEWEAHKFAEGLGLAEEGLQET